MDLNRTLVRKPYELLELDDAKWRWSTFRKNHGLSDLAVPLITAPDGNAKTAKTMKYGYNVCGLALASSDLSGVNVCRYATPECRKGCLAYAGHNGLQHARAVQIVRTKFLEQDPRAFLTILHTDVTKAHAKYGDTLAVRLNMLSDITWERVFPAIFELPITFYDYTKWPPGTRHTPENYSLTYSASEKTSDEQVVQWCKDGHRVAVVFNLTPTQPMITKYCGVDVVDGDSNDMRWLEPHGVIIGLRAKGVMRKGTYDMVRKVA